MTEVTTLQGVPLRRILRPSLFLLLFAHWSPNREKAASATYPFCSPDGLILCGTTGLPHTSAAMHCATIGPKQHDCTHGLDDLKP